jgi:hypothetical protein
MSENLIDEEASELYACLKEPITLVGLRRIMLLLARHHFRSEENYGPYWKKKLCGLVYVDEKTVPAPPNRIQVDLMMNFTNAAMQTVPAFYIGLGEANFRKISTNSEHSVSYDNSRTTSTWPVAVPLTVSAVGRTPDQSVSIAESFVDFLLGIRSNLIHVLGLTDFQIISISPPRMYAPDNDGAFITDITGAIHYNYHITSNIEGHRIKKIGIALQGKIN